MYMFPKYVYTYIYTYHTHTHYIYIYIHTHITTHPKYYIHYIYVHPVPSITNCKQHFWLALSGSSQSQFLFFLIALRRHVVADWVNMVDWADCGTDDDDDDDDDDADADADAAADDDDDDDDDDDGDDIPIYPLIRTCKYPHACINTCIYTVTTFKYVKGGPDREAQEVV